MDTIDTMGTPVCTSNSLADVVSWINCGDFVSLYTQNKTINYHKCDLHINTCERTILVDVSSCSSLLDEGEWPWYIEDAGHTRCTCSDIKFNKSKTYAFKL
jgi:hypothetical protein